MKEGRAARGLNVEDELAQVTILSESEQAFAESWFDLCDEDHFWFRWRLAATLGLLRTHDVPLQAEWRAFEVGCGSGVLLSQLERATRWTIDATELNRSALGRVRQGRGRLYAYDILEKRKEFHEVYDAVIVYDVLEHIADTRAFLDGALHHLKPGGLLLVNVPALSSLWSAYDTAAGHLRRYDQPMLRAEFAAMPLEVLETRYWGFSLIPTLVVRKMIAGLRRTESDIIELGFRPPGRLGNAALCRLMDLETALLRKPPLGTSVLLLGRKPETD